MDIMNVNNFIIVFDSIRQKTWLILLFVERAINTDF